jgi:transposase-like protein
MPKRRRRSFTPQFKPQVVFEVLARLKSQAEIARQHRLKPELIARWKEVALVGLESLFRGGEQGDQDQERVAGRQIREKHEVEGALKEMIAHGGPYVLDVLIPYQEHILPMIPAGGTVRDIIMS